VDYIHFNAKQFGYTISWWPRETSFFSTTERIELAGIPIPNTDQGRVTGDLPLVSTIPTRQYELPLEDIQTN
jgi:hypothetical protein